MIRASLKVLAFAAAIVLSAGAGAQHDEAYEHPHNDVSDVESLQRGAKYFVNYCLGCHSADYVRYSRVGEDLLIPEDQLETLMFTGDQPFDTMSIAMSEEDANTWFGVTPPDLSLIARSRGTDYLYEFLRGFYVDASSPTGVDNMVLPGTAMPHVLWELQGIQSAEFEHEEDGSEHFVGFHIEQAGLQSPAEYDETVRDIVNFLDYMAEPMQLQRQKLGIRVIAFLLVLLLLSYLLKREVWKDVK